MPFVVLNSISSMRRKFIDMKEIVKILKTFLLSILSSGVLFGCDATTKGFLKK